MTSTVYFAKWILLPDSTILSNGALVVTGNTISSIGHRSGVKRTSKDRAVNLGKRILLPGLINMHTHLEEGMLRGNINTGENEGFTQLMLKKDSMLKNALPEEIQSSIRLGIRESLANGITTIVDVSRTDYSPAVFREEPCRAWIIHEVFSLDDQNNIDSLEKRTKLRKSKENIGIGPYAFFSLPPSLHKLLANYARLNNYIWSCHMAESAEELQAFSEQTGDLYFHITRKNQWPFEDTKRGSMYYALTHNLIPNGGILFHCNYVSNDELSLLAAKNVSVVICSQYSDMVGQKGFPMESALKRGISICLGTESPVNSFSMNLFDELYNLKTHYPHISARTMFDWITKNPALALKCVDTLGSLEKGKMADIIGIPLSHEPHKLEDVLEEVFQNNPPIDFVMVNGEEIIIGT